MPFTLSHVVLAPPIAKLAQHKLPIAALAIGSMTPDLYRLFTSSDITETHQWSSLWSYNLALGSLITLLWYGLYRPVLFRFFNLYQPLVLRSLGNYLSFIVLSAISIIIGAATHILWDGLTHLDERTYAFYDFLSQNITFGSYTYPMHRILQMLSSIVALPPLMWMLHRYVIQHRHHQLCNHWIKYYAWGLFAFSFCAGAIGYYLFNQNFVPELIRTDLYYYVGRSLNQFASYFLIVFSLGCLLFKAIDIKHTSSIY